MRMAASERRSQLVRVAVATFARQGFYGTSMNDIADAAGVTKPVLYQHFRSKRSLYKELLSELGAELRDSIAKVTSNAAGPREQISLGIEAYFAWVAQHEDAFKVLFGDSTRRDPEFADAARRVERSMAELVAEHIDIPSLNWEHRLLLGNGIVGMVEAACRSWLEHEVDVDASELAAQVSRLAWAGLRGAG
ncbi:MAG: TetR/AcrR family transcriptional regulator [Microthrixaceae bacterium]